MSTFILLVISGIGTGAMYFILASGLSLIFGLMKILSFAHGAFLAIGGYAGYLILNSSTTTPTLAQFGLALLAGAAAGGVIAYLTERFLIRPLRGRETDQLLVTLGLGLVLVVILAGVWGYDPLITPLPAEIKTAVPILGAQVPAIRLVAIAAALLLLLVIQYFLKLTRHGLIVRAGVENREMVEGLGIRVQTSFTLIFVLGGVAAGFGGVIAAGYTSVVSPLMGDAVLLYAFIVLVVGGLGSITGAALASVVIALLQTLSNFYIFSGIGDLLAVATLAVVLLAFPKGITRKQERLV